MTLFQKILSATALAAFAVAGIVFGALPAFGSFNPTGAGTYLLNSSISSTQATITLTSFTEPGSGIPYTMSYINTDVLYGTISPSSGNSEFISATGINQNGNGTATLTGVIRGLSRTPGTGGCVASSTLARAFPGQSQFILSNSPCYYSEYAVKKNDQTIAGDWTFSVHAPTIPTELSSAVNRAASISYVNSVALSGAPNASETVKGIVQLATALQAASTTSTGSTAARLVIPSSIATDTPSAACNAAPCVVLTKLGGKTISQLFLDIFTTANTWAGAQIYNALNTFNAAVTIAASAGNLLTLHGVAYNFPSAQATASTSPLVNDSAGNLSWGNPIILASDGSTGNSGNTSASTTVYSATIPANTLGTIGGLDITAFATTTAGSGGAVSINMGNGSATTSIAFFVNTGTGVGLIHAVLYNNASASFQRYFSDSHAQGSTAFTATTMTGSASIDTTAKTFISVQARVPGTDGSGAGIQGITIRLLR